MFYRCGGVSRSWKFTLFGVDSNAVNALFIQKGVGLVLGGSGCDGFLISAWRWFLCGAALRFIWDVRVRRIKRYGGRWWFFHRQPIKTQICPMSSSLSWRCTTLAERLEKLKKPRSVIWENVYKKRSALLERKLSPSYDDTSNRQENSRVAGQWRARFSASPPPRFFQDFCLTSIKNLCRLEFHLRIISPVTSANARRCW